MQRSTIFVVALALCAVVGIAAADSGSCTCSCCQGMNCNPTTVGSFDVPNCNACDNSACAKQYTECVSTPNSAQVSFCTQVGGGGNVGVIIVVVLLIIAAAGGGFWFWKRRQAGGAYTSMA